MLRNTESVAASNAKTPRISVARQARFPRAPSSAGAGNDRPDPDRSRLGRFSVVASLRLARRRDANRVDSAAARAVAEREARAFVLQRQGARASGLAERARRADVADWPIGGFSGSRSARAGFVPRCDLTSLCSATFVSSASCAGDASRGAPRGAGVGLLPGLFLARYRVRLGRERLKGRRGRISRAPMETIPSDVLSSPLFSAPSPPLIRALLRTPAPCSPLSPSTPRCLLIMGLAASHEAWLPLIAELLSRVRCAALAVDNRGCGRSFSPSMLSSYRTARMARDARECLRHAGWDATGVHVVGHSMGGMIAAKFAALYPSLVRGLVLVSSSLGGWSALPTTPRAFGLAVRVILAGNDPEKRANVDVLCHYCKETLAMLDDVDLEPDGTWRAAGCGARKASASGSRGAAQPLHPARSTATSPLKGVRTRKDVLVREYVEASLENARRELERRGRGLEGGSRRGEAAPLFGTDPNGSSLDGTTPEGSTPEGNTPRAGDAQFADFASSARFSRGGVFERRSGRGVSEAMPVGAWEVAQQRLPRSQEIGKGDSDETRIEGTPTAAFEEGGPGAAARGSTLAETRDEDGSPALAGALGRNRSSAVAGIRNMDGPPANAEVRGGTTLPAATFSVSVASAAEALARGSPPRRPRRTRLPEDGDDAGNGLLGQAWAVWKHHLSRAEVGVLRCRGGGLGRGGGAVGGGRPGSSALDGSGRGLPGASNGGVSNSRSATNGGAPDVDAPPRTSFASPLSPPPPPFPVLVVHGREDAIAPASRGASLAHRLRAPLLLIEGGHFLPLESRRALAAVLVDFVAARSAVARPSVFQLPDPVHVPRREWIERSRALRWTPRRLMRVVRNSALVRSLAGERAGAAATRGGDAGDQRQPPSGALQGA